MTTADKPYRVDPEDAIAALVTRTADKPCEHPTDRCGALTQGRKAAQYHAGDWVDRRTGAIVPPGTRGAARATSYHARRDDEAQSRLTRRQRMIGKAIAHGILYGEDDV